MYSYSDQDLVTPNRKGDKGGELLIPVQNAGYKRILIFMSRKATQNILYGGEYSYLRHSVHWHSCIYNLYTCNGGID